MPAVHFEHGPQSLTSTPGGFYSVSEASPSFVGLHSHGSASGSHLGSSTNKVSPMGATASTLGGTLTRTGTASGTVLLEGEGDPKKEADFLLAHLPKVQTQIGGTPSPPRG